MTILQLVRLLTISNIVVASQITIAPTATLATSTTATTATFIAPSQNAPICSSRLFFSPHANSVIAPQPQRNFRALFPIRECSRRRQKLRLRSQAGDKSNDALEDEQTSNDGGKVSDYRETSNPVKAFVGGLTDVFVWIGRGSSKNEKDRDIVDGIVVGDKEKAAVSVEELADAIRQEYDKNYLWTGDINDALYEEDCSFTDPTLSFSGLSTYKRNVASLQGVLNALVTNSRSVLYSCQLRQEELCVETRWRMVGDLRLPWGPTIDVVGRTKFSYDPDRGNRIRSYDEVWEMEPAKALMQIFLPGKRKEKTIDYSPSET